MVLGGTFQVVWQPNIVLTLSCLNLPAKLTYYSHVQSIEILVDNVFRVVDHHGDCKGRIVITYIPDI